METNGHDVVIIGGGLGGLEYGYILSKKGLRACVIEKERQAGECLQTFKRNGNRRTQSMEVCTDPEVYWAA